MKWFIGALTKKYSTFSGRAQRAEYWCFALFSTLLFLVLAIIDISIGTYNGIKMATFPIFYARALDHSQQF